MEASSSSGRIGGKWPGQALSGRRVGIYIAVAAAILAGVLMYAFVQHYRKNATVAAAAPTTGSVVISTGFIPEGMPASQIAATVGFEHATVPLSQALPGAITDASALDGEVATKNIYPGEQIVATDFATGDITLGQYLTSSQRAIEFPIDSVEGLQGYIVPGDHVDIVTSTGKPGSSTSTYSVLAANVTVLAIGTGTNGSAVGSGSGSVVVAASVPLALTLAKAADSGKFWLLLRPPVWATPKPQATSTTPATSKAG